MGAHAPLQGHALSHADFARRYLHAARYIPAGDGESFFPRLHLFGQAIELALKSYLWRRGQSRPVASGATIWSNLRSPRSVSDYSSVRTDRERGRTRQRGVFRARRW